MTEKTADSTSSDMLATMRALADEARHARDEAWAQRETVVVLAGKMESIEREYREHIGYLKEQASKGRPRFDVRDVFLLLGLGLISGGISVAFHWSYAMIAAGVVFLVFCAASAWNVATGVSSPETS